MFLLARTEPDAPKHRGISFFLMDFSTPGITIQPLVNMGSAMGFNQVFFDKPAKRNWSANPFPDLPPAYSWTAPAR